MPKPDGRFKDGIKPDLVELSDKQKAAFLRRLKSMDGDSIDVCRALKIKHEQVVEASAKDEEFNRAWTTAISTRNEDIKVYNNQFKSFESKLSFMYGIEKTSFLPSLMDKCDRLDWDDTKEANWGLSVLKVYASMMGKESVSHNLNENVNHDATEDLDYEAKRKRLRILAQKLAIENPPLDIDGGEVE